MFHSLFLLIDEVMGYILHGLHEELKNGKRNEGHKWYVIFYFLMKVCWLRGKIEVFEVEGQNFVDDHGLLDIIEADYRWKIQTLVDE